MFVCVNVSYNMAVRRLAKLNILVNNDESVRILGEIDTLCCGLQGIFTTDKQKVVGFYYNQTIYENTNSINVKNYSIHRNSSFQGRIFDGITFRNDQVLLYNL